MIVNAPLPFQGTEEERWANRATHHFSYYDHEEPAECIDCCARTYHVAADYPCGVEPPRGLLANGKPITEEEYLKLLAAQDFNDAEREDH